jgi:hypothetical protein
MPLYRIERDFSGMTPAERDGAGYRTAGCLLRFPGMKWLRSYLDPERLQFTCIYEAASPEELRQHATAARIPCGTITEVVEVLPDQFR